MFYRQLRKGVNDNSYQLIPAEDSIWKYVKPNHFQDYYTSIYKYSEDQYQKFLETGSIKGVNDVVTDRLVFDFDSKDDLVEAQKDAVEISDRLISHGIKESDLRISFSGGKGFHVEVYLDENMTVDEFKAITKQLANGLKTFDKRINDHARPFRALGSVNIKTGLFKIPVTLEQLKVLTVGEIQEKAKSLGNVEKTDFKWSVSSLPESIKSLKTFKNNFEVSVNNIETTELDWNIKPKFLTNCRFSLQNGYFGQGDRNNALLCLAATYKNLGFDIEHTYRLLKGVAEKQSKRNGDDRYPDSEIYNNIVMQVYSDDWKGGQFTCRDQSNWLYDYCQSLGNKKCNHKEEDALKPKKLTDIHESFKDYVVNIDKNTIVTGIKSLDEKIFLSTGANVGIIGSPGSGKTSLILDIAENTSKNGVRSVLASLDMHYNRLYEKALYRVSGLSRQELYKLFQSGEDNALLEKVDEKFGNVNFFHKSCPTVSDLREYIIACNEQNEDKIKLVMLDYFERVVSDLSDDTAASKRVAGELQDLVNDLNICLITLVQPNKMSLSGGPDTPIMSYTSIKGSSYLYQSFRIIFSLWRPFYNPKDFSDDKYMQMAILKNDLGELAELDFGWNGKRGMITELEDNEKDELRQLLKAKSEKKDDDKESW